MNGEWWASGVGPGDWAAGIGALAGDVGDVGDVDDVYVLCGRGKNGAGVLVRLRRATFCSRGPGAQLTFRARNVARAHSGINGCNQR